MVLRLCCPVVVTVTRKGNIRIYIYIYYILYIYILYILYILYIYIYIYIFVYYLCIACISSHSKGPEQDQLRSPFVPYVRNTAERSTHNFDSQPYDHSRSYIIHYYPSHLYCFLDLIHRYPHHYKRC